MAVTTWIIITLISLTLSGLFSGSEIAYITSDRVRVELDVKKGGPINRIINLFYSHREMFISTILVGNNIVLVIYGMGASALLDDSIKAYITSNEALVLLIQTLVSTGIILLTGEFFPKTVFRINPNTSLRFISPLIYVFYIVLWPVSAFTTWLSKALMRLCGIHGHNEASGVLSVGELNNYIERSIDEQRETDTESVEHEVKIFHNALDFSSTQLRDCMIPRNEIVAADLDTITREELSELFTKSGRSKIVVYSDDIDNICGYIHVSELFDPEVDWRERVKPVIFVPETLLANKLMRRLLSEKRSMAVVVDEFGGTAGLVTLEDLVEEIFGDIEDEHDSNNLVAVEVAPGVYDFSGRTEVRDLRDTYHIDIPEEDEYQTLAGYLLYTTGTIPAVGEEIVIDKLSFTVMERTATRILLVRVAQAADTDEPRD